MMLSSTMKARIKAAKEKTQMAQGNAIMKPPPPPAQEIDLLSDFDAPSHAKDPPPAYGTNFLPPPPMEAPPPAFEETMQFAPPPPLNSSLPPPPPLSMDATYAMPPPPPAFLAPPEASAPSFEDLLGNQHYHDMPTPVPPPPEIDEDILAALDPAEREAILEEQRKILEQIEKERSNDVASSAAARAMAFDQRSGAAVAKVAGEYDSVPSRTRTSKAKSSTASSSRKSTGTVAPGMVDLGSGEQVPLHGQEKTQKAIQDGTALIVQCLNCQNWMQVTKDATLMFCPTCQVVSPVLADEAATSKDMEAAAQLAADAQLAEKLQAEEYGQVTGTTASASTSNLRSSNQKRSAKLEKGQAVEKSWYDWFMGSSTTEPAKPTPDRGSAEIRRGLVAASTGEESYGRGSYDESERLMGSGGGGGARLAESKGMFACVADAVGSAVYSMNQDEEGNVHGVDASGLLAMPNVSRQRD